jgi:DNA-binding MarR family transcriptional regulator
MTELAERAFSSRSAMTRRVDRLVGDGLLGRSPSDADGRGLVVALTEAGVARLAEIAPVHLRGVGDLFVAPLGPGDLAAVEVAMSRVTIDAAFG